MNLKNHVILLAGVLILFLSLLIAVPSHALNPNIVIDGTLCPLGMTAITNGCKIAGTYQDADGNDFRIDNASSTNPARIQWVEGTINKLILTGVTIVALENVTNATLIFKRKFTSSTSFMNTDGAGHSARTSFSGGFNLLFPNQTQRTATAEAFAELCAATSAASSPSCTSPDLAPIGDGADGVELKPGGGESDLAGTIAANKTVGTYAPQPKQQDYPLQASDSKPLLRGKIVISSLRNSEKASNLSQTLLIGPTASMPPFDSGDCDSEDEIGKIIRGAAADGSQDTICVKLDEGFQQMAGEDALTLAGVPECPTIPGEAHRPK